MCILIFFFFYYIQFLYVGKNTGQKFKVKELTRFYFIFIFDIDRTLVLQQTIAARRRSGK